MKQSKDSTLSLTIKYQTVDGSTKEELTLPTYQHSEVLEVEDLADVGKIEYDRKMDWNVGENHPIPIKLPDDLVQLNEDLITINETEGLVTVIKALATLFPYKQGDVEEVRMDILQLTDTVIEGELYLRPEEIETHGDSFDENQEEESLSKEEERMLNALNFYELEAQIIRDNFGLSITPYGTLVSKDDE